MRAQDGLQVLLDPTGDRAKVADAIRAARSAGRPDCSIPSKSPPASPTPSSPRPTCGSALLYITDSNIYNYREDFTNPVINSSDSRDMSRRFPEGLVREKITKLRRQLAGSQTPLFIVHLAYRSDRLNEAYQSGLMQLAAATGGAAVFCRSATDVGATIAKALETIGSLYSVTVDLPRRAGKNIQVQLEAGDRQLSYRSRFSLAER